MNREELEFSISQYVDGTLPAGDASPLEELLATDASVRELLAGERRINALLKSANAQPAIDLDAFHARVSAAIAKEPDPATSYRIGGSFGQIAKLALAASVMLAVGLAAFFLRSSGSTNPDGRSIATNPVTGGAPIEIVAIDVRSDFAQVRGDVDLAAPPVLQIAVGPSARIANEPALARYADDMVSRPSRVIIASSVTGAHDVPMPY